MIAATPSPPYYAVIFTSERTESMEGYENMAEQMVELASQQEGFLGVESVGDKVAITVSYWKDLDSIRKWKMNADHLVAQQKGKADWYQNYKTRVCKVERDYGFEK